MKSKQSKYGSQSVVWVMRYDVSRSVIQTIEPKAIEWNVSEGYACLETRSDENVVRVVQMVALSVCVGVWVGGC